MNLMNDFCKFANLCPFMIVVTYNESSVCAIYLFLCQDLSWVNGVSGLEVLKAKGSALNLHKGDQKGDKIFSFESYAIVSSIV